MSKTTSNPTLADHLLSVANPDVSFQPWKEWEKVLFRFFALFLVILIVPLDWKYYQLVFSIDWSDLHFYDLLTLTKYQPQFIPLEENGVPLLGVKSFYNWGIAALIAGVGAYVWGRVDHPRKEYTTLYYWLRVLVRFRLAIVLIAYGFFKLFPLQMPYPSLSNLLTNYGDFYAWKIYFQTVGIAPKYESFLGFVEIIAAFLIFNRRTVTFGVGLIIGFLGNVAVANGFYDIGEQTLSTLIVLLSAFLFAYDIPRLYQLLIQEKTARANRFIPQFTAPTLHRLRIAGRTLFYSFVVLYAFKTYQSWANDPYKYPKSPGLKGSYGYYNVQDFVVNNDTLAYSKTDPQRWQDVVFEQWSTLSIKVNRPVKIDLTNGEGYHPEDIDRNYEIAGFAGRHYFHYQVDTLTNTLYLQNKNRNHRSEKMVLTYRWAPDSTLLLTGTNENQDSIRVALSKINKKFLMFEGRRRPVKI
ncbi:hypothetical protein [Runella limosa]|uniref:hypothetical protein n=1 Tax=Runella limosa TaxID=370978 RepID=UPI00040F7675|nr:hypothetical protein [Runella limosa]